VIYPVPVRQLLSIKVNQVVNETITWTVFDAIGRKMICQETNGASARYGINVAGLAPGVYTLHVTIGKERESIQFIKE
jgi:hypothetical protein